ncbi:MAG: hypothetical protein JNK79_11235 [Chitinophagaceae bacterium]|nr:hypothetical protein [Chitinophagaceae bacterium]
MNVKRVFINTYRYDFYFARICIASIRYWYPDIPIFLIKDQNKGSFNTSYDENLWKVNVLDLPRKKFGWGYGKLETLFLNNTDSFFVIDADAVITGPVLDTVETNPADFIVDKEVQPAARFNEIYFRLDKIHELDLQYVYPGYSFNTGQWFGTSGLLRREDFKTTLNWSEPPESKKADIVFNNDQTHLNYVLHTMERLKKVSVSRINLMVWPEGSRADFIDLEKIKSRSDAYPFVIHWAGMSALKFSDLPRQDILNFYRDFYYSKAGGFKKIGDSLAGIYLDAEKKIGHRLSRK